MLIEFLLGVGDISSMWLFFFLTFWIFCNENTLLYVYEFPLWIEFWGRILRCNNMEREIKKIFTYTYVFSCPYYYIFPSSSVSSSLSSQPLISLFYWNELFNPISCAISKIPEFSHSINLQNKRYLKMCFKFFFITAKWSF